MDEQHHVQVTNSDTNATTNGSTSAILVDLEFRFIKITLYFLILTSSTLGNGLVAYVICSTRKMRTSSNYLILNLAVCDMLTPLISIPFDFVLEENKYEWIYGGIVCRMLWPASTLTATVSALTLAVISLDRYRLIMHPFKPRLTSKQVKIAIVCIYVISTVLVTPYASMLEFKGQECVEEWPKFIYRQAYTAALFVFQYALPLPFMVTMYALALSNLYTASRKSSMMQADPFIIGPTGMIETEIKESNQKQLPRKTRKFSCHTEQENDANKKATKMFTIVLAVFAIFMLPNQLVWLWGDFGGGLKKETFNRAVIICWLFTYTNSVFNPVIFTAFSKDFRHGFKNVFRKVYHHGYSKYDSRRSSAVGCRRPSHPATTVSNYTMTSVSAHRPVVHKITVM